MKVLMITGDKNFKPGHPRYDLQAGAVEKLAVVYWGRGSASWRMWSKIPKGHFDVVTAQYPLWRGHLAAHLAWLLGAKLNLQVHTDLSALSSLLRWWAAFNLRKADSVRVVSEKIKQQVEHMHVRAKITLLPIFIDIERFRAIQHMPHLLVQAGEQKTILWVGRFEAEKDPLHALSVLKKVREADVDTRLVLLGAGNLEKSLRAESVRLSLTDSVEFPGWQDPVQYLAIADVMVCTSLHESWGASIIEALAAGVPVVAPDVGVAREAGAVVVPREQLVETVVDVLQKGTRGTLRLHMLSKEEWASAWVKTL